MSRLLKELKASVWDQLGEFTLVAWVNEVVLSRRDDQHRKGEVCEARSPSVRQDR
jgi:hypothetical protein